MALVSIPVPIELAETARNRLSVWLDNAEAGEATVVELDSALASIIELVEEQRIVLRRATER